MADAGSFPKFEWNEKALRYVDANTRRFVSEDKIRQDFADFERAVAKRAADFTKAAYAGEIKVAEWQQQMADLIRPLHVAAAALGAGGYNRLSRSALGRIGRQLRLQYEKLEEFSKAVADHEISQPMASARAELYVRAAYLSWQDERRAQAEAEGFKEERSVLQPAEHCDLCVSEAAKGWQPIGTLIPIGKRSCRNNDRCIWLFRR